MAQDTDSARPTRKTLDQERAQLALAQVRAARGRPFEADYLRYVRAFPATILMNGLGQAIATWLARAKQRQETNEQAYGQLVDDLAAWMLRGGAASPYPVPLQGSADGRALIGAICEGNQASYIHARAEALVYLAWLKKLAQGLLGEERPQAEAATEPGTDG